MTNMNDGSTDSPSSTKRQMVNSYVTSAELSVNEWCSEEMQDYEDGGNRLMDALVDLLEDYKRFVQDVADYSNDPRLIKLAMIRGAKP